MRVANAPCSWGVLEFEPTTRTPAPSRVLDEIAATGYAGTELGEWGFFATDPRQLREDLVRRGLSLVGAFVPVALSDPSAHAAGEALALKTARLLAASSISNIPGADRPLVVLSDATAAVPGRAARAGRIHQADGLSDADWDRAGSAAERIARIVQDSGLRTVFHHHCATYVETAAEIDALMQRTAPDLLGLCVDTGHATYGGADPVALISRYRDRVWHVHFKDCSPTIAARARDERWDYLAAVRQGVFCELGTGQVDFAAVLEQLRAIEYDGWIVVEQDVLPSMGTPAESAARNRRFLARIGV
jgi:inosose dehydratase